MGGSSALASTRNPEKLPAEDLAVLASVSYEVRALSDGVTHEPFGDPAGPGLWHHKGRQLPAYIQQVAHGILKSGGGDESRAIATAVSRCKFWCGGGGGVKADTKAKACAAVAEWEALKSEDTKAAAWDSALHPRLPKGQPGGGEFGPGGKGPAPTNQDAVGQGESSQRVTDLQKRLNALGFRVKVDGKFGPQMEAAVRKFQATHVDSAGRPLKVDGLVGPLTTSALRMKTPVKRAGHKPRVRKAHRKPRKHASAVLPDLVTMPGVELLAAGSWELSSGRNTFTRADIQSAIDAVKCPAVGDAGIKLGHVDPRFDGEPAVGRVVNLRANASGDKLIGDLTDMPGWLGGIAHAAFPKRSVEGSYGFRCQIGHDHPFVLTGLALLGITPPGVSVLGALPDIASLYGIKAAATQREVVTAPLELEGDVVAITEEDVRRAYYAHSGAPSDWWITELQMSPTQLVVSAGDGTIYRVPFSIEADDGEITFEAAESVASYQDLAASRGTGRAITYASAAESRSVEDDGEAEADVEAAGGPEADGWVQRDGKWVYDPDNDGDDDSTAAGDTDNSHFGADGKLKPGMSIPPKPASAAAADPPTLDGDNETGEMNNSAMTHGSYTGTHAHAHAANGSQGSDATHSHSHTHSGDAEHGHTHAGAATNNRKGATEVDFTDEQEISLRKLLGLSDDDDLTPESVINAGTSLREKADAKVSASGRYKPPAGVVQIEQEQFDRMQREIEASARFRAKVERSERDEVIGKAVRDGKFSAARLSHWSRLWDADPEGTREVLATLKKNVVPVDDIGAAGGNLDDDAYEAEFASLYPPGTLKRGN